MGKNLECIFWSIFLFHSVCVEDPFSDAHNLTLDAATSSQLKPSSSFSNPQFSLMMLDSIAVRVHRYLVYVVSLRKQYINEILALGMYTEYSWGAHYFFFLRFLTSFIGMFSKRMGVFGLVIIVCYSAAPLFSYCLLLVIL